MIHIEQEDKKWIVYCHENLTNHKKYIGITSQKPNQRWRDGKGYKSSPHFYRAIQKYGWDGFEHKILYENLTEEEAKEYEVKLISEFNTRDDDYGYNMTPGGEGYSGEDNPWYGKHHSLEARQKMSEQRKGRIVSEETRRRLSKALKGRIISEETKKKMRENHADFRGENSPRFGKPIDPEHQKKMVRLSKTPEAIEKMKQNKTWYSGKDNPNSKRVICLDTGIVYDTVNEAAAENGVLPSKVSLVCHGHRIHTGGLHFAFYNDEYYKDGRLIDKEKKEAS